jgi:methylated-DNA-[protein]-cysteine S-methyltransferase
MRTTLPGSATAVHETPAGPLRLSVAPGGVQRASFAAAKAAAGPPPRGAPDPAALELLSATRRELDAYFAGRLRGFTVPLDLRLATPFTRQVLRAVATVPYGATTSYGRLADQLGRPRTTDQLRAVGAAVGANPLNVLLPCHRVVGADGRLVGYAGGLPAKRLLLALEGGQPVLPGLLGLASSPA